ncbi:Protein MIZU-KUSSEI 1, partial [Cucurbita argyrosperma subsp. sororia]
MQTNVLQKEMSSGMVRIALECEKRTDKADKTKLMEEPLWTMFCNGKKNGYGVKREASDDDLKVMEILRAVSMGAGVLPGNSDVDGPDGEQAYMRAHFERVVGSRDSETFYMLSPEENSGPELSIFFHPIRFPPATLCDGVHGNHEPKTRNGARPTNSAVVSSSAIRDADRRDSFCGGYFSVLLYHDAFLNCERKCVFLHGLNAHKSDRQHEDSPLRHEFDCISGTQAFLKLPTPRPAAN